MTMVQKEERYYLCEYFRVVYLLKILFRDILFKHEKAVLYYIKPNRSTVFIEKNKGLFSKIFAYRIAIKQLPDDATGIDDYSKGLLYRKVCIDRLYDIIHRIDTEMLQSKQSLLNFLDKKLSGHRNSLKLYIKHQIALDIMNDFLLVEIAGHLLKNPLSIFYKKDAVLFIDRKSYWSRFVFEYADGKGVSYIGVDKFKLKRNKAAQLGFCLIQLFIEYVSSLFIPRKFRFQKRMKKIGIPYYVHKNFTEFFDKRNYYLFWYPESGIEPQRIVIYSDGNMDIPPEEKERMENLGFTILSCNTFFKKGINLAPKYRCSFKTVRLFFGYVKQLIKLLFRIRTRLAFEEYKILAVLFIKLPYWEDFFSNQNIWIKFRVSDTFSHRDIAANLAGAATISYNYTNHSPDTSSILHQDICDIYFVWGDKHQRCILKEHSDIKNIIRTGYIFDYTFSFLNKKAERLRKAFIDKGKNFVIALMGETVRSRYYGETILNFYRLIFEFLLNNPDIGLIIKPKKDSIRNILESSEKTSKFLYMLQKDERVKVLDSSSYPVEAGKASDLAIGVYADSTAALECSLAGVPAIIYECFADEQESNSYLKYGKNKIVFYDIQAILDSIKNYKLSRNRSNGFADWSKFLKEVDSFRDGKANKRIGFYIKTLLGEFDSGLAKYTAIKESNRVYANRFGSDTVTSLI